MSIDIQDNYSGFITIALPGKTSAETRRLITLATCATQFTHATKNKYLDDDRLDRFSNAFYVPELRKTTTSTPSCANICSTPSNPVILIDAISLLILFARTSMLITSSPTRDTDAHSLMTIEEAAAQLSYEDHFYQGGLSLVVKSPIRLPPDTFFRLILPSLLSR